MKIKVQWIQYMGTVKNKSCWSELAGNWKSLLRLVCPSSCCLFLATGGEARSSECFSSAQASFHFQFHLAYASEPSCNVSLLYSWVASQSGYCNASVPWKIHFLGEANNLKGPKCHKWNWSSNTGWHSGGSAIIVCFSNDWTIIPCFSQVSQPFQRARTTQIAEKTGI